VPICPRCGEENPERAKFCLNCAAPLAFPAPERRKLATLLFCDVSGSTKLGEELDPETLRRVMGRYFDEIRAQVELYGGSVEKFVGDAAMAAFGIPRAHEDDALRAVRAAAGIRERLPHLAAELGIELRFRTGVNTGEVVVGDSASGQRLATGDAVNVAARLEQAAQPGEILLGEQTYRIVRAAVEVEPLEPLALRGKSEPVGAYRLVAVREEAEPFTQRLELSLVGRRQELASLHEAWLRAGSEHSCQLYTIVGKSRLAEEFLVGIEDAATVRGRCLPYGEGITYWPVVEVVKQLEPHLAQLGLEQPVREAIARLLGREVRTTKEEIAWAFRKLLEAAAAERALVLLFDDIQWGEEAFLDLVEHVAYLSSGAPLLLVCLARPDLLERRPGWPIGLRLDPLGAAESEQLVEQRLAGIDIEPGLRERMLAAAGGNPLFVEELAAMVRESGDGEVLVPPTIQALLAARLDQLDPGERTVLERAAVEGEVFHRGALQALAPEERQLSVRLTALVRSELIRPEKAQVPGEDAFCFRHLLIRDAAYNALPKATLAELHERFADWLEEHGRDIVELDEILGYHLERTYRYREELGTVGEETRAIAERAVVRLATAGGRAHARGDVAAAVTLLGRALELTPPEARELERELDLADALVSGGRLAEAETSLAEVAARAEARADRPAELRARLAQARIASLTDPKRALPELLALAEEAMPLLEESGDEAGLMEAWNGIAWVEHNLCHFERRKWALEHALVHARAAGEKRRVQDILGTLAVTYWLGPTPVEEGLRWLETQRTFEQDYRVLQFLTYQAALEAMRGRIEHARSLNGQAMERAEELGNRIVIAHGGQVAWWIETLAGDWAAAEQRMRQACNLLEQMGEQARLSTYAGQLAQTLCALDRYDEAEEWSRKSEELGAADDVLTQMLWRQTRAQVLARRGELGEGERLAREAVALAEQTDLLIAHGDALLDLAEALVLAGRREQAATSVEQALALYERKGNLVMAERARARLVQLQARSTAQRALD
jgi:class 3 adenylate cyclase/tetratricopeptide (TPR) repeat protein